VRSYSSIGWRPDRLLRQAAELRRVHADPAKAVAARLERVRELEAWVERALGRQLAGLDILDVGPGQLPTQLLYFARRNRVAGVDTDVVVTGCSPRQYATMLRRNGLQRTLKTIGRKVLGVDRHHRQELLRQLGLDEMPAVEARVEPAEEMTFPDESFDVVYALAVFQHLARPEEVLRQMVRVLRPGGALYLDFILYTSQTGSHDLRLLESSDGALPLWAHLRPEHRHEVVESAYLNRLRLTEWRALFERVIPGAQLQGRQAEAQRVRAEAEALRRAGELAEYDLEELCTTKVAVLWLKPASDQLASGASSSLTVTSS
jgi:SAM-dependent methyltransferase